MTNRNEKNSLNGLDACMVKCNNYEAVFNSMNEGLFIVNTDGIVMKCNRAFYEITGLTEEQVLGQKVVQIFCKNRKCGLNIAVSHTMQTSSPCNEKAMDIIRPDQTIVPAVFSTAILKDQQGRHKGIVVLFRDVSQINDLKKKLNERYCFHSLVSKSRRMQEIYGLIEDVADTDANVLIFGESGTGKELVAGAIHFNSRRTSGDFVRVSCAALSESLLESELFGHVKGAFTGAINDKIGRFELAHQGTILLDEIGEIGPAVQVKLLRVLQEREIERVGDVRSRKVDVRIIAATNRDLWQLVKENRFREDLYYRLKVITVDVPPLRQRKEDIALLAEHFIEKFNRHYQKQISGISPDAMDLLMEHDWPGNVRELENAIEHAFVKVRTAVLCSHDFPLEIRQNFKTALSGTGTKDPFDRSRLISVLKNSGWNQARAARKLGIHRTTVWRNIQKFNIKIPTE